MTNILETVREDDFVEYFLFPPIETADEQKQEQILNELLEKANLIVEKYVKDFLWHKDEFKLVVRTSMCNYLHEIDNIRENLPPHLYGVTHYGDNIEDEWFIVFILQQLSKEITDSIIRIHDADGEFLLIEAADYLPEWSNPETCQNRVYIFDGNVHLIPRNNTTKSTLLMTEALSIIRNNPTLTIASQDIQDAINLKLREYPQKLKDNIHNAIVNIPIGVAKVLQVKPNLISAAVHAFCNRDSIDVKACKAMRYFPPENRVKKRITFTKCLYAMLMHSKYVPDRRTGWNLPSSNSKEYKSNILGCKLACGFEILASQAKLSSTDIESDKNWLNYLKSLKNKGYFQEYIENSNGYNNLLNKAKEYYINHRDSMHQYNSIGEEVLKLSKCTDIELNNDVNIENDDNDDWLNINPDELDKMLQERYGHKKVFNLNNNSDAGVFTEKLSSFLNHMSDIEGAEFPDECDSPVRPPRKKDTEKKSNESSNKVNFDPNAFSCALQNILNFAIPEDDSWDLESDSDMSEYEQDNYVKNENYEKKEENKLEKYMEQMDKELETTTIGKSFKKKNVSESFDDIESFAPVDINVNALKYILESYKSQMGEAGPSSNLLGPMGVHLNTKD